MKYDSYDQGKHTPAYLKGTASLYERISEDTFVIITAAHNFVQFEKHHMRGVDVRKEASETTFYLACDGDEYAFKFKVLDTKAHPLYS